MADIAASILRNKEARAYLTASRSSRNVKAAAIMSVLSDAQQYIAFGDSVKATEAINIAKLIAVDPTLSAFADELFAAEAALDAAYAAGRAYTEARR